MINSDAIAIVCAHCGSEIAPSFRACPNCGRLIHSQRLQELAEAARLASERGDVSGALEAWREALDLLPPGSRQHQVISQKITELGRAMQSGAAPSTDRASNDSTNSQRGSSHNGGKAAAGLGAIGLLLLKFKTAIIILLTKGKLLLLGLSKASTFLSMLLAFGAYWAAFGWQFALGLVLCTYVHEMGHVIVLRRYGFKADAPMFIPGLGAFIRLKQHIVDPREDAAVGLAGPIYGMGAVIVTAAAWYVTKLPILAAIAGVNAWINLFNLLPVWTLDGGRAFHAMSRMQRFIVTGACAGAWFVIYRERPGDGSAYMMLMILTVVCGLRAISEKTTEQQNDRMATFQYVGLVLMLSLLSLIQYQSGVKF